MKAFGVYGEKTLFRCYLAAAVFSLVFALALLFFALTLGIDWLYYALFFFGASALYTLYLAFYEGVFRYEALRESQGKIVKAKLSHQDPLTGIISPLLIGIVNYEAPNPVVGQLVGTFGPFFHKKHQEGDVIFCYRLKSGELLVIADQKNPERFLKEF
jgi:hypothetical protein